MQTSTVYQTRLFRDTNPSPASHKWTDSFFFFLKWCRARSTAAGDRIKVSAWLTRKESRKKASQTHFILCFYTSHLRVPTEYSEQQSLFEPASTCRAVKPVMRGNKTKNHSSKLSQHSTMLIVGQQTILQRCRSIPLFQGLALVWVSDKEDSGICFSDHICRRHHWTAQYILDLMMVSMGRREKTWCLDTKINFVSFW